MLQNFTHNKFAGAENDKEPQVHVSKIVDLTSRDGAAFTLFEKSPSGGDLDNAIYLYEELVAPTLKTGTTPRRSATVVWGLHTLTVTRR